MQRSIAYELLHFPYFTETFVAEEIRSLRSLGIDARIISLLEPGPGPVQPVSEQLLPVVWYAPRLLSLSLWRAQGYFLLRAPGLYLWLLRRMLSQPYHRKPLQWFARRLQLFAKGVSAAYHLRGSEVELIHAHFGSVGGAASWVTSRLLGVPFTITLHAYDIYAGISKGLLPLLCEQASHVVTISEYNREHLVANAGCSPLRISVIPQGVDLEQILLHLDSKQDDSTGSPLRVLSVGSLTAKKGHGYLLDACHILNQQGVDLLCTIIGGGRGEAWLRSRVQQLGLQEQVRLLGERAHPEVMAAFYQHDIFVLACIVTSSGDRDGIPVALMEAGAAGLPLLSTTVSGIPELVRHGETGLLVPPADANALAEGLLALANDPVLRIQLGEGARSLVEEKFNSKRNAATLAKLFDQVIAASSPAPDE